MDWNPCWTFDSAFASSRCFAKGVSWRTERSTGCLWGEDVLCSVIWSVASCQRAGGGSWWEQFRVSPWLSWDMLFRSCCLQPPLSLYSPLAVLCNLCLSCNCAVKQMLSANSQVHTEPLALELELHFDLRGETCFAVSPESLVSLLVKLRCLQMVASSTVLLGPWSISAAQSLTTSWN